jgi:Leucine-rich repeat (LRR) protein
MPVYDGDEVDDIDEFGGSSSSCDELSLDEVVRLAQKMPASLKPPAGKKKVAEEEDDQQTCATAPTFEEQPASNGSWTSSSSSSSSGDEEDNNTNATNPEDNAEASSERPETVPVVGDSNHSSSNTNAARLALLERDMIAKTRGTGAILIKPIAAQAACVAGTQVLVLDKSLVKSKADALSKASASPSPGAPVLPSTTGIPLPPTSPISRDIAKDMALLRMSKKKKKIRSRSARGLQSTTQRSGRSLVSQGAGGGGGGAPLNLVYAESNLCNKSEYMEALHEVGVSNASASACDEATQSGKSVSIKNDRDSDSTNSNGEISVPSLWREKHPHDSNHGDDCHTEDDGVPPSHSGVPLDLFNLEASIRASQRQHVTSLSSAGPGAFQVQVPVSGGRPPHVAYDPSSASHSSSLTPPPELTPYVVEARLVMDDPNDEDDDDDESHRNGSRVDLHKRNPRGDDDVEMAVVEAKPVVEATPVYEPSAWKRRCTWLAIVAAVLVAVGAAIGITLGVANSEKAPAIEPSTNETRPIQHSTSSNSTNIFSADPIGDLRLELPDSTLQAINDEQTPQAKAYQWATAHLPTEGNVVSRMVQRFALATLYYSTAGADWSQQDGWLDANVHECDWYYDSSAEFACYEGTDAVTRIGLSENNVRGSIPPELGLLTSVESLLLSGNEGLGGPIPDSITNIKSLSGFFMSANALSGSLPTLHPATQYVFLWSNRFSGSFPDEYEELVDVRDFVVRNNLLTGSLPVHMWHRWEKVESIDVSDNNLQGTVRPEIGFLTGLTSLGLMSNQFTGPLPTELGKLTAVKDMFIGGNSFSSTVPTEIANMKSLVYLDFFDNDLTGRIPSDLHRLGKLEELCIEVNLLTGALPTELASLSHLTKLSLFGNELSGTIPSHFASLKALTVLDLDFNFLMGPIPQELGALTSVSEIHLASNQLNGTVPTELGDLTSVTKLDLSDNQLTGTIPSELGALTSLQVLNLHENLLTGSVPFELCTLVALKSLTLKVDCDEIECACGCHCASNATARNFRYSA